METVRIVRTALNKKSERDRLLSTLRGWLSDIKPYTDEEVMELLMGAIRGGEIVPQIPSRTGALIGQEQLKQWWEGRVKPQTLVLGRDDYLKCLLFAIRAFYRRTGMTITHFGRREQRREMGQWLSNQTEGKLGEIAVQKFLQRHGIQADLDWTLRETPGDYLPDIASVWRRPPNLRVSIKTTKFRGIWLDLPKREVDRAERGIDAAILVRIGLPEDHFLRVLKEISALLKLLAAYLGFDEAKLRHVLQEGTTEADEIREIWEEVPSLGALKAYVVGYALKDDLHSRLVKKGEKVERLGKMEEDKYVLKSGELRWGCEWRELIGRL